ncbi:MAG: ABC transporter ATP-binding protein [Fusobacteria bacterium]|nr:ABC transporter ATP-binding protein [Fusobacteriota bacterium]
MIIKLDNITKIYDTGAERVKALKNVNLGIKKGEFVAIIGSSGSGKSTMMNILGCLDVANEGKYFLDGIDISLLNDNEIAEIRNKKIGFVFQSFNLLSKLTALENVEVPMVYSGIKIKDRQKRAFEALERVGLADRVRHRPNELSGGQKQRVAIARSLVNNPKVILADEPTGNLDSNSEKEIMDIFKKLNEEGVTVIMVTHEPEIAAQCKRIVTFKDGIVTSDKEV